MREAGLKLEFGLGVATVRRSCEFDPMVLIEVDDLHDKCPST